MRGERILVTAALPYANGPIHIGHLVEYIQTDIWVRFQKLLGRRCIFVCADDTHGTAIMLRARKEGRSEAELIAEMQAHHERDFAGFDIQFDNYGSTNCSENLELCQQFWSALREAGLVVEREVSQLFDTQAGTFLADRFVKGTCPKCHAPNQYGDNCDKCGATYSPVDLLDPKSTLTDSVPVLRNSVHLFVELEKLHGFLEDWALSDGHLQGEVANYLKGHFLGEPLRDWDISRPAPYFGFEIPDSPGNYWYVWFDAPIGYIASTWQWCKRHDEPLSDWWQNPETEVHHFIGKDITYFHTLFWPGMLKTAGFNLPTQVHIHGFLNVAGEKMSKSKGTFVTAETYLKYLDPAYLRYYFASKLGPRLDDLDLNLDEFVNKINADLVGKVVNLASRCARFVQQTGLANEYPDDGGLFESASQAGEQIAIAYQQCDYAKAMRLIMELADRANPFVENAQPWVLAKDETRGGEVQAICTVGLNLFRQLAIYLAPVLPKLAGQCGSLFGEPITSWDQSRQPVLGTKINTFEHMLARVKKEDVASMIEDSKDDLVNAPASNVAKWDDSDEALLAEPLAETCTIDDFVKVDLRVARIVAAEQVPDARKLLKLTLSLGGDHTRTVFAGIKAAYEPEKLIGRLVVCVANLAPRQMKFGLSEGMVTAAGSGGTEVYLLSPDSGAQPGQRVH
ncbi:MAG: methionine--tRNA ligase [Planctomycetales bacterium]|nr:methionine--tRNA ligase [Planctomycetales bacterium]